MIDADYRFRPWRCLTCGERGYVLALTADPDHPIGLCGAERHPCGRVLLTDDPEELAASLEARRAARWAMLHPSHLAESRPDRRCPHCAAALARLRPARHVG